MAVAPQLGHDAAPDRLRHRGRRLPGGAVPAGPGHRRATVRGWSCWPAWTGWTCPTPRRCSPTRRRPSCPSGATCARPCSTAWWRRSATGRSKSRWDAAWALLVRALETGAPDLVVVPATTLAALRRDGLGRPGGDRAARRSGVAVPAGGPGRRPGPRRRGPADERRHGDGHWTSTSSSPPGCTPSGPGPTWRRRCSRCTPWSRGGCRRWPSTGTGGATSRRRSWTGRRWRSWPGCGCTRSRTCCATTTGAATGSRAKHGLTGPGERLRMNIAADCEINDDVFGDGLVRPEGAVEPALLGLPAGQLMEDYLRQFRLGPHTQELAWLDCGSGADGLDREWDLGPDGAHGLSEQERDAVRFRVAQGITGRPGERPEGLAALGGGGVPPAAAVAGAAGRGGPLGGLRRRRGRGLHLRPAVAALGRACPASSCRACGAGRPGSPWSSTPPGRSATPNWAARCSRSPRSPAPWAADATWSPCCRATRRPGSRTRCAAPRASR